MQATWLLAASLAVAFRSVAPFSVASEVRDGQQTAAKSQPVQAPAPAVPAVPNNTLRFRSGNFASAESELWKKIRASMLLLTEKQKIADQHGVATVLEAVRGSAICIDSKGLFLAHQNSVHGKEMSAMRLDGTQLSLRVLGKDRTTELVLLEATKSVPTSKFELRALFPQTWSPVEVATDVTKGRRLVAVLPNGAFRAEVAKADIVATSRTNHQVVAVNEIHFDAPEQLLTGALVFDQHGKLVGLLGAVSQAQTTGMQFVQGGLQNNSNSAGLPTGNSGLGFGGGGGAAPLQATANSSASDAQATSLGFVYNSFGPSGLQQAYALSPVVLARVVNGFKSSNHEVRHPALGATCADALNSAGVSVGALVQSVAAGSAADKAGLKPEDIIVLIDGQIVNNPVDYAWLMLNKDVDDPVRITIRRGDTVLELHGRVGAAAKIEVHSKQKLATQRHGPGKS